MISFFNGDSGEVVVVGFAAYINGTICDLSNAAMPPISSEGNGCDIEQHIHRGGSFNKMFAVSSKNWGNGETEWEKALNHDNKVVRALVTFSGKFREITSKDPSLLVRVLTLKSLLRDKEALIDDGEDKDWLSDMLNDPSADVRALIAEYGMKPHIEILMTDSDESVRVAVARKANLLQLQRLINDPSEHVRAAVARYGDEEQRVAMLKDESEIVRASIANSCFMGCLTALEDDDSSMVKIALAKAGYKLDKYATDDDVNVRIAVAQSCSGQGDGRADILVNDVSSLVREALAGHSRFGEALVNDPDEAVRIAVAKNCDRYAEEGDEKCLPILVKDPSWLVRHAVAKRGYGLLELSHDEHSEVSAAAIAYPAELEDIFNFNI